MKPEPESLLGIHERFSVRRCPKKPTTTLDLEGCAEREILQTDAAIETSEHAVFSLLGSRGRRDFVRAERAWLGYREAICNAESSQYRAAQSSLSSLHPAS